MPSLRSASMAGRSGSGLPAATCPCHEKNQQAALKGGSGTSKPARHQQPLHSSPPGCALHKRNVAIAEELDRQGLGKHSTVPEQQGAWLICW